MHDEDIGAVGCLGERHRHRAAKPGIGCLELEYFDHLLVGHKLHEVAMERVGARC